MDPKIHTLADAYLQGMTTAKEFRDNLIVHLMNVEPESAIIINLAVALEAKFRPMP